MKTISQDIIEQFSRIDKAPDSKTVFDQGFGVLQRYANHANLFKVFADQITPELTFFLSKEEQKEAILACQSDELPTFKTSITVCDGFGFVTIFPPVLQNEFGALVAMMYISPLSNEQKGIFIGAALGTGYCPKDSDELNARIFSRPYKLDVAFYFENKDSMSLTLNCPPDSKIGNLATKDANQSILVALDQIAFLMKTSKLKDVTFKKLAKFSGKV